MLPSWGIPISNLDHGLSRGQLTKVIPACVSGNARSHHSLVFTCPSTTFWPCFLSSVCSAWQNERLQAFSWTCSGSQHCVSWPASFLRPLLITFNLLCNFLPWTQRAVCCSWNTRALFPCWNFWNKRHKGYSRIWNPLDFPISEMTISWSLPGPVSLTVSRKVIACQGKQSYGFKIQHLKYILFTLLARIQPPFLQTCS